MLLRTLTDTLRQPRLLVLLFGLTLLPALPSALALYGTINDEADRSLALLQLLPGLNYTVFADFMHTHDGAIWSVIRAGLWTALLSLVIGVWARGGMLYSINHGFSAVAFWQSGTHYFGRNGRLLLYILVGVLLWLIVLFMIGLFGAGALVTILGDPFTERGYTLLAFALILLFFMGLTHLLCVSQYAGVLMYQTDESRAIRAFWQGWRLVGQHRRATFGRFLLLLLAGVVLMAVYLLLESTFSAHNWLLIGLLFLGQQAFVLGRVALGVWSLRVAYETSRTLTKPVNTVAGVLMEPT